MSGTDGQVGRRGNQGNRELCVGQVKWTMEWSAQVCCVFSFLFGNRLLSDGTYLHRWVKRPAYWSYCEVRSRPSRACLRTTRALRFRPIINRWQKSRSWMPYSCTYTWNGRLLVHNEDNIWRLGKAVSISLFSLFQFSLGEDWECRSLGFHGLSGQGEKAEKQRKKKSSRKRKRQWLLR